MRTNIPSPAVRFVEQIVTNAIERQASDIHFEPQLNHYRIRIRIDGLLSEVDQKPIDFISPVTCRLKIMAQCDIAERRLPQDGRFTYTTKNNQTRDCRLSTCPTIFGEKVVVRLLNPNQNLLQMTELGLSENDQTVFLRALKQPQGLILVTGPTGSGKTLTLYTALQYLNQETYNISTVEQPVEIRLAGINQVNVHEKVGLTFANVLRALLRQDPDVIMVGEIRDQETAQIAVHAAQTGHLVLSTLHTNSASDTLIRLVNMGIAPFNIASSVSLVIAQRLVRKKINQGYQGRTGVFEMLPMSDALNTLILKKGAQANILQQAKLDGMVSLWEAALEKVNVGITDMAEIYRAVQQHA